MCTSPFGSLPFRNRICVFGSVSRLLEGSNYLLFSILDFSIKADFY